MSQAKVVNEKAPKSGKYGESKTKLAGHPEATKTASPIASAAATLYPKKKGLRGKDLDA